MSKAIHRILLLVGEDGSIERGHVELADYEAGQIGREYPPRPVGGALLADHISVDAAGLFAALEDVE